MLKKSYLKEYMVNIAKDNAEQGFYSGKGKNMLEDLADMEQELTYNWSFGGFDYDEDEEIIREEIKEKSSNPISNGELKELAKKD